jgi:hypothetical protein
VFTGVTGNITDSLTGLPVEAVIAIPDHDRDNSEIYTQSGTGHYFRLTGTGSHVLEISAPGYQTRQITVHVTRNRLTRADVALSSLENSGLFPNPFRDCLFVYIYKPGEQLMLELIDLSGRKVLQILQPVEQAGKQEIRIRDLSWGAYLVRMTYGDQVTQQIIIKVPE